MDRTCTLYTQAYINIYTLYSQYIFYWTMTKNADEISAFRLIRDLKKMKHSLKSNIADAVAPALIEEMMRHFNSFQCTQNK